ncbi:PD-(D/E)XK nuclease domain-containing protein, partial [Bacteroides cellulosilyticus]
LVVRTVKASVEDIDRDKQAFSGFVSILFAFDGVRDIQLRLYVDVEVRTPDGRVDMVMRTPSILYVIELKLNKTADIAMQQIDLKNYPERFALCGLPIVKV